MLSKLFPSAWPSFVPLGLLFAGTVQRACGKLKLASQSPDALSPAVCCASSCVYYASDAVYTKDGWVGAVHSYKLCTSSLASKPLWLTVVR